MRLVDKLNRGNEDKDTLNLDRVFEALGVTHRAALEFSSHNIEAFNEVCQDSQQVDYYSIGAKKAGRVMSKILKDGHDLLTRETFGRQSDGILDIRET